MHARANGHQAAHGAGAGTTAGIARQRTLASSIHCLGVGLHSGVKASMTLHPAEPDTGIVFVRSDLGESAKPVPAIWCYGVQAPLCTALEGEDGTRIVTVEHLMAAFAGCGVDNAVVEVDAAELPIMDGSAAPFVFLIECAGIAEQDAPRRALKVMKPVRVADGERWVALSPGDGLAIDFEIEFDSPLVSRQSWSVSLENGTFKRDICRARTFGFLEDVDRLRAQGLALGGSLDNAVVVSGDHILNEGGLRYENEFVRHKILDTLGDLYLAGAPIIGRFSGVRAGHALNLRLLTALFADPAAWCWSEAAPAGDGVTDAAAYPRAAAAGA